MRKKLIGLLIIGVVAAIAISGTISYLSDTETSTGNTFTAGIWVSLKDMAGYWRFDEETGNMAYDFSGSNNDGTLKPLGSEPTWVDGKSGKALSFDGNNDYVSVNDSVSLNITGQISIEAWIKPPTTINSANSNMRVVDKQHAYYLLFDYPSANGKLKLVLRIGGSFVNVPSTTNNWNAGQWYHIVGTYDGSTMKIYVNGALENSKPQTGNIEATNYKLFFGTRAVNNIPTNMFFNGIIDEVKIYSRALSANEILEHYNAGM